MEVYTTNSIVALEWIEMEIMMSDSPSFIFFEGIDDERVGSQVGQIGVRVFAITGIDIDDL